ncbi:MAG: T9SS type A sorting domain-containing protein [Bacteroidales bacterium]|nr:T9SS type A sorting domain-containing protein [Bacteroidales bacterium]
MKKTFTILILSTFFYFFTGLNVTFSQEPLNFQGSVTYSPVLVYGGNGSWEEWTIILPYAFVSEGTFYIFYTGFDAAGIPSIGMASSSDGYSFTKYAGNPVFTPSGSGFDSFSVTQGIIIHGQTGWIMYYNGREQSGFGPGPSIGIATATDLTGPWTRDTNPILTVGSSGEWDSDFIAPNNIFQLDTGGFIMFYSAGDDFSSGINRQIGMAISPDGLVWTKYDDPATTNSPYSESDPVLKVGDPGEWDDAMAWECSILKTQEGFEMYYTGGHSNTNGAFGYAYSPDGISWSKDPLNPVYTWNDDPYALSMGYSLLEQPALVIDIDDSIVFMYYDYGIPYPGEIAVATADLPVGIKYERFPNSDLRMTIYPNPVYQSTTFSYTLKEQGQVILSIFDSFGRLVDVPVNTYQQKGKQQVYWNAETFPVGIYFYLIQAGNEVGSGKMIKW